MLSPQQFSKKTGLSYDHVLHLCKSGKIDALKTEGGHFKIPEMALEKYAKDASYVTRAEYLKVVRDNERLKTIIKQLQVTLKTWSNELEKESVIERKEAI